MGREAGVSHCTSECDVSYRGYPDNPVNEEMVVLIIIKIRDDR